MIDELFESGFGIIFRFIKGIVKNFVFDIACNVVGWLFLKIITVGKYPGEGLMEGVREDHSEDTMVSIVGLIVIIAGGYYFYK